VTAVRIFLEEDSSAHRLIAALRNAGLDVVPALELGRARMADDEQMEFAVAERCLVVTANKAHLASLHTRFAHEGREHWGIVIRSAQTLPAERFAARLLDVIGGRDAESLKNALLFL